MNVRGSWYRALRSGEKNLEPMFSGCPFLATKSLPCFPNGVSSGLKLIIRMPDAVCEGVKAYFFHL